MNIITTALTSLLLAALSLIGLRPQSTVTAAAAVSISAATAPSATWDEGALVLPGCSDGCAAQTVDETKTGPGVPYSFFGLHVPVSIPWSAGTCVPNGAGCAVQLPCSLHGRLTIENNGTQPIKVKGSNVNGEESIPVGGRKKFDLQSSVLVPLVVECGGSAWLELTYKDEQGVTSTIKWTWTCSACN